MPDVTDMGNLVLTECGQCGTNQCDCYVHLWIPVGSLGRCCGITLLAEGNECGHSAWA